MVLNNRKTTTDSIRKHGSDKMTLLLIGATSKKKLGKDFKRKPWIRNRSHFGVTKMSTDGHYG